MMIQTTDLTKRFGDILAVDRLTLSVDAGEVFGFLGPNGAGKTTTIRLLTALIAPTSGHAKVAGCKVGREDGKVRRRVGILTESPGLYDRLSAERNLDFFARLYEVDDVDGQVERYLRMLGLWDRRHEEAGTFSKGMRQKLAIARALLNEPALLLADEPTGNLDSHHAEAIWVLLRQLVDEQKRTVIAVTHEAVGARHADRIIVLKDGRIVGTIDHARDTDASLVATRYTELAG